MPKPPDSTKDEVLRRVLKPPPKPHTQIKGKPRRAESHKGNKVQPARQRNMLQKGR